MLSGGTVKSVNGHSFSVTYAVRIIQVVKDGRLITKCLFVYCPEDTQTTAEPPAWPHNSCVSLTYQAI